MKTATVDSRALARPLNPPNNYNEMSHPTGLTHP